jgi:hypothetical protein
LSFLLVTAGSTRKPNILIIGDSLEILVLPIMLKKGSCITSTRQVPWQPLFGKYVFRFNDNKTYCPINQGYRELNSGKYTTPSRGKKSKLASLYDGKGLSWDKYEKNTSTVTGVDHIKAVNSPYCRFLLMSYFTKCT